MIAITWPACQFRPCDSIFASYFPLYLVDVFKWLVLMISKIPALIPTRLLCSLHCRPQILKAALNASPLQNMSTCGKKEWDEKVEIVKKHVNSYPDFPKKGILFRDIFSVFRNLEASTALQSLINDHVKNLYTPADVVLGLESRGFLFGPQIAFALGVPFVPVRKKGKLPGELVRMEYDLEYGTDIIELQKEGLSGKKSALIVDDLLATGGTMKAAYDLVKACGVDVVECFVVMELTSLGGRSHIPASCFSIISYD